MSQTVKTAKTIKKTKSNIEIKSWTINSGVSKQPCGINISLHVKVT